MEDKTNQLTKKIISGFTEDDIIRYNEWLKMGFRFMQLSPEAEIGQMAHEAFHELDDLQPIEPISIKDTLYKCGLV